MADKVIQTQPLNPIESTLREKFAESIIEQSALMDKLAQQLITLELAIPGLYATVLKLIAGDTGKVAVNNWFYAAFGCWFVALLFSLISLIPRNWKVDTKILKADATGKGKALGIEDFYRKSASYKLWLLIPSALLFAAGIACSAMLVFQGATP